MYELPEMLAMMTAHLDQDDIHHLAFTNKTVRRALVNNITTHHQLFLRPRLRNTDAQFQIVFNFAEERLWTITRTMVLAPRVPEANMMLETHTRRECNDSIVLLATNGIDVLPGDIDVFFNPPNRIWSRNDLRSVDHTSAGLGGAQQPEKRANLPAAGLYGEVELQLLHLPGL